mmetsp:Transcript_13594/g.49432  ORF Transcript_13594/g.49432 Transcript_13594/m.49432 type:complete len:283 (+) Transcript_13594:97-945(+)
MRAACCSRGMHGLAMALAKPLAIVVLLCAMTSYGKRRQDYVVDPGGGDAGTYLGEDGYRDYNPDYDYGPQGSYGPPSLAFEPPGASDYGESSYGATEELPLSNKGGSDRPEGNETANPSLSIGGIPETTANISQEIVDDIEVEELEESFLETGHGQVATSGTGHSNQGEHTDSYSLDHIGEGTGAGLDSNAGWDDQTHRDTVSDSKLAVVIALTGMAFISVSGFVLAYYVRSQQMMRKLIDEHKFRECVRLNKIMSPKLVRKSSSVDKAPLESLDEIARTAT